MSLMSSRSLRTLQFAVLAAAVGSLAATPGVVQGAYQQTALVSDGYYEAPHTDANSLNPWGLAATTSSPWWVGNNHTGKATIYDANGVVSQLVVDVPSFNSATGGPVTGVAFNPTSSFVLSDGGSSGPATFLFACEDGTISAWNPNVPPPPPSHQMQRVVDNSGVQANYKGLAVASSPLGDRLYAADFHNARIDIFDGMFAQQFIPGVFVDPSLPSGYAPFNIMNLGGELYVAFALVDTSSGDEIAGPGLGFVSVFDASGVLLRSLIHGGQLNAPWGMAIAPSNFGQFSDSLLVANFGNGTIHAYDRTTGALRGILRRASGFPIHVEGLWGIAFGNGGSAGLPNVLYFTAGPADETHGVFGSIIAI
jgi:uncharacterized protein (TIGR03118 family)